MTARVGRRARSAALAALLLAPIGAAAEGPRAVWTLLAVGDTGREPKLLPFLDGQRAVAQGLTWSDEREPADALVLLGDNFYWEGLRRGEVRERILGNLVIPYCRFLSFESPRSPAVETGCDLPMAERHPIPVFAVLGNHDHMAEESPTLETEEIPLYLSNWMLPPEPARAIDLAEGVSLVLFDSTRVQNQEVSLDAVTRALRESRGPWRILVAHHPVGTLRWGPDDGPTPVDWYTPAVQRAIQEAGVRVQLMLAGHEHNLQIIDMHGGSPALVAISGSGSSIHELNSESAGRVASAESLGFTQIRLVRDGETERLHIRPFATSRPGALLGLPPRPLGEWSVDLDGTVRRLDGGA